MGNLVFSGIQPSGAIHIGNYAGAIRNWIRLQEEMECIFCIVDYHAMTMPYEPKEMQTRILEAVIDVMACGIDPERSRLFVQSHVPEHTELAWILSCVAPMGELNRMTQFKEKSERLESVNVGLFTYPVLQAADILLYKADTVPVGEDQVQHLEVTRVIARRFNTTFGELFPEPQAMLTRAPRIMSLNDPTRKMSKSIEGSAIMLSDSEESIRRIIRRAVTDTGPSEQGVMSPGVANLFTLLEVFASEETIKSFRDDYEEGKLRYKDLKQSLTDSMLEVLRPIRERRQALSARPQEVREIVVETGRQMRRRAADTLQEVREKAGLGALP
ncbi:MAG: tryptophan--tRNA ligase [Armatimonadetes bacterium]|nr:tryptophan--tRNA ligase [Armatimonadota bacterium]